MTPEVEAKPEGHSLIGVPTGFGKPTATLK